MQHQHHHHTNSLASKLGMSLSILCAIHCLAMPFVISFLPFAGSLLGHNEWLEGSLIGGSLVLAGFNFRRDYMARHRSLYPAGALAGGFLFVPVGFLHPEYHILSALSGILIFSAYVLNWRLNARFSACEHE